MENSNPQFENPYAQSNPYAQPAQDVNPYLQPVTPVFEAKPHRKVFSRTGLSYFAFLVVASVLQVIIKLVADAFFPGLLDNYLARMLLALIPMYLGGAPVAYLILKKVPSEPPERRPWGPAQYIGGFVVAYGFMYLGNFIGTYIGLIVQTLFPGTTAATNEVQNMVLTGEMWVNVLFMVMVGPVVEELLFRKLLVDRFKAYGDWIAVLVSGLMFGLFHGNLTQGIYTFLFGCILAYIYLKTGNILITISYHVIINFLGSVIPLLVLSGIDLNELSEAFSSGDLELASEYIYENSTALGIYGLYMMMVFGGVIAGIVIFIVTLARGRITMNPGRIVIPSGKRFSVVMINVGMILFVASCLLSVVLSMIDLS